jgi:hypothetical protein
MLLSELMYYPGLVDQLRPTLIRLSLISYGKLKQNGEAMSGTRSL